MWIDYYRNVRMSAENIASTARVAVAKLYLYDFVENSI